MAKTKFISVSEYAEKINPDYFKSDDRRTKPYLSRQAIKYRITKDLPLPEVISYKRVGKVHVLEVKYNF